MGNAATNTKDQSIRDAIEILVSQGRDVTTAAILAWLHGEGHTKVKPAEIHQSAAWQELAAKERGQTKQAGSSERTKMPKKPADEKLEAVKKPAPAKQAAPAAIISKPSKPNKEKASVAKATTKSSSEEPEPVKLKKAEAVRQALTSLGTDAPLVTVVIYVKQKFDQQISAPLVSYYKRKLDQKRPAPKVRQATVQTTAQHPARSTTAGTISIDDIKAVKGLVDRLGPEKVRDLSAVLAK